MQVEPLSCLCRVTLDVIEQAAQSALLRELACYPKPGLVSFVDAGSHDDMDVETFLLSIDSLQGYFGEMALAGANDSAFMGLKGIGMAAEERMLKATGNVNTHRGAVFGLGLLAAAAGQELACGHSPVAASVCRRVVDQWGDDILHSASNSSSHGAFVRRRYGALGAREEAAAGFRTVTDYALPALHIARMQGTSPETAVLQAFFASLAVLEDTNILFRGGAQGLEYARSAGMNFLSIGGVLAPDYLERALHIHQGFIARRLSPGGSADVLSATLFLDALELHKWD